MSSLNFQIGTFSQCISFAPQKIEINNFEQYTLYCVDCENVQSFELKADKHSVFLFFGNFKVIGQKAWQQIIDVASQYPHTYCFNTIIQQKNFADIYCATMIGQIIATSIPKRVVLVTNDMGFYGISQALHMQGRKVDVEMYPTKEVKLLTMKSESQTKPIPKNLDTLKARDEEIYEILLTYPNIKTRYASVRKIGSYLQPILRAKNKTCKISAWVESDFGKKVGRVRYQDKMKYFKLNKN